ncbi:MAG: FkbM family methyltransferase [Clostridia bacterium]|nr:FkbM family methyltransferase [Clostridia bacterium]
MIKELIAPLPSLCETLASEKRAIVLYGMGTGAEKIYSYLKRHNIEIKGIVASDGFVRGNLFLGFNVKSIKQAESELGPLCLVLCFGLEGERSHFLAELAKQHRILSPNLPVFGETVCDKDFIIENAEGFERVYESLADELSREIFVSLLKYNATGEIKYLDIKDSNVPPSEFFNHSARHIDIGAYDGDTVAEFVENSNSYADIVAFEPDRSTYKKLCANTKGIRGVIAENSAVGDKNGEIAFASGGGRASHSGEGNETVSCVSVDSYCGFTHIDAKGVPVGSIKIDAEGMDKRVIYGAVNTIYCCKCAVSVALYHRGEDIIELPMLLKKHYHKYDLYLRKKEYVPAWDVFLYAIPRRNR